MKKSMMLLLVVAAILATLAACSSGEEPQAPSPEGTTPPVETQPVQESEAPVEEETPDQSNAAALGDYYVEIKSASLAQDYKGNPAIVVTYAWTNNSDDTTSSMTAVSCSAFQDGVELETAIITDDSYDSDSFMTEVRPGTTIDIQAAFVLPNTTSIVEVEVGEWITFESDSPIAYMEFDPAAL